jgi:hypothetical protein
VAGIPTAGYVTGKTIDVDGGADTPTLPVEIPDL